MNKKLEQLFNALEADKQKLLQNVMNLNEEALNYARPGSWSILQIIAHLLTAELGSLNYMKKKVLGIDKLENSGIVEILKLLLLKTSQRIPFKYKAPKQVVDNTPVNIPLSELLAQWNKLRNEMKIFLDGIEDKNIYKKVYKHPIAGYLNVIQGVSFLREHFNHHVPQIKRLINDSN